MGKDKSQALQRRRLSQTLNKCLKYLVINLAIMLLGICLYRNCNLKWYWMQLLNILAIITEIELLRLKIIAEKLSMGRLSTLTNLFLITTPLTSYFYYHVTILYATYRYMVG